MAGLPREAILQAIRSTLLNMGAAGAYNYTLNSCEIGYRPPDALNQSDFPIAFIEYGVDRDVTETEGAGTNNRYSRAWDLVITGILWPEETPDQVRISGERLIDDIVKALTADETFGNSGCLWHVIGDIHGADIFEVRGTRWAWVEVGIQIHYDFIPANL